VTTMTYDGRTYPNGRVPAAILDELEPIGRHGTSGTAHAFLRADAAEAWNRAAADVKERTGLDLTVRGWNRTLAEQKTFFHRAYTPQRTGGTDARTYGGVRYVRRRGAAAAAIPGRSNHGWGLAVDVNDFGAAGDWTNARRRQAFPILAAHGWTDNEGRQAHVDEPWHLVYDPDKDSHRGKDWLDMATKKDVQDAVLAALETPAGRKAVCEAVWTTDGVLAAPADAPNIKKNPYWTARGWLGSLRSQIQKTRG
jgi:hypothetical protein